MLTAGAWGLALMNGLRLALVAPPVAAAIFGLVIAVRASGTSETQELQLAGLPGLALLFVSGAYVLGLVPAFLAGCALPWFSQQLHPVWAACATGALGMAAYLLTFGWHQLDTAGWIAGHAAPAFLGAALPAFFVAWRGVER